MALADIPPLTVHAYDITTGDHLLRLPYTACSWSEAINEPGSMQVTIDYTRTAIKTGLWDVLRCWRVILAAQRAGRIIHAGPLTDYEWDAENRSLRLTCGGGLTLLTKRLVIGRDLNAAWNDRTVLVDEQHPAGDMDLTLKGSWADIIRGLTAEALQWGDLPISLPAIQGGDQSRTYYAWDLATTADRITDITKLDDAPELRLDPIERDDGGIAYRLNLIRDEDQPTHTWTAIAPGQRITYTGVTGDGANMTTQTWLTGGKDNDKTLICRRTAPMLEQTGVMHLMTADTTHTTISDMTTLQQAAIADLAQHAFPAETHKLKAGEEHDIHAGDHIDVTVEDDLLGLRTLHLKATGVDGSADTDWQTIQAQERQ